MMIITVDGPSASGKGTLAKKLSQHYHLAFLDTGLLYRAVAAQVLDHGLDITDQQLVTSIAAAIKHTDLNSNHLRTEAVSQAASKIAVYPDVRSALLLIQHNFVKNPPIGFQGVILDGRDIGTRICPEAPYKFFVTANVEVRAERRYKELQEKMIESIYSDVLQDMIMRDERDQQRSAWPLQPADDAIIIDTTNCSAGEALEFAVHCINVKAAVSLD